MRNPFKKEKKKKKQFKEIDKKNIKEFLKTLSNSIDETFSGQESITLEKVFKKELENWIHETVFKGENLNPRAVKLGVCLGLLESLRKINETEEKQSVTYVS